MPGRREKFKFLEWERYRQEVMGIGKLHRGCYKTEEEFTEMGRWSEGV